MLSAAASAGVDLSEHRSTQLSAERILDADLVLGMTRHHVREVVLEFPAAWAWSFTLRELVRRGKAIGPALPGQPIGEWIEELHRGRRQEDLVGVSKDEDIADPYGGSEEGYRRTVANLSDLVDRVLELVAPTRSAEHQGA
jgi:protein-tyrosine phosphatase